MKYWTDYWYHSFDVTGTRKCYDTTIYTLDIETSSYIILNDKQLNTLDYLMLDEDEKEECEFCSTMYIWMVGINSTVYYGRTYTELYNFFKRIDGNSPFNKIFFVHNLSFEFQFLMNIFNFSEVFARKSHKVIKCKVEEFNVEFRCSYMMSRS